MTSPDPDRDPPVEPDANAIDRPLDTFAGADSSPWENAPSGEKADAAREPQNAPVPD